MLDKQKKEIKQAAAISYDRDNDEAPKIVALGKGDAADKIIEVAKENKVPVLEDKSLVNLLNALNIGDQIPTELYGVVAEVLLFISNMDRDFGERNETKR